MKYTNFSNNPLLFGQPDNFKEWLNCWRLKFQGSASREKLNGEIYWAFNVKDKEKFIRNHLTWRDEAVDYGHESFKKD